MRYRFAHRMVLILVTTVLAPGWACYETLPYRAEGTFEREFRVETPLSLEIENRAGDIRIVGWDAQRVVIRGRVEVRAFAQNSADDLLEEIRAHPPVRLHDPRLLRISPVRKRDRQRVRIDYELNVPRDTEVELRTGAGDIDITRITGPATVMVGAGRIEVEDVGRKVRLTSGAGDVRIRRIDDDVTVTTGVGDITAERVDGEIDLKTGTGDVELSRVSGELDVKIGVGDIQISSTSPPRDGAWRIDVGTGDVEIVLPEDAEFWISAKTGLGSVRLDFPLTRTLHMKSRAVEGTVGSGGLRMHIRSGMGTIRIQSRHATDRE